jgi:hypothetical protein
MYYIMVNKHGSQKKKKKVWLGCNAGNLRLERVRATMVVWVHLRVRGSHTNVDIGSKSYKGLSKCTINEAGIS